MRLPALIDLPEILEIKSLIRKREAQTAYRYCGVDDDNAYFLDLPFYKTGKAQKKAISPSDINKVKEVMNEIQPQQIFVAGDKASATDFWHLRLAWQRPRGRWSKHGN